MKHSRFTVRDLLLLTTIVALSLGWWLDRSVLSGDRESLSAQLFASQSQQTELNRMLRQMTARARSDVHRADLLDSDRITEEELHEIVEGRRSFAHKSDVKEYTINHYPGSCVSTRWIKLRYEYKAGKLVRVLGEDCLVGQISVREPFRFERQGKDFVRIKEPREERPLTESERDLVRAAYAVLRDREWQRATGVADPEALPKGGLSSPKILPP